MPHYPIAQLIITFIHATITQSFNSKILLTLPISAVHETTIVFGTVVDSRTSEVMLIGLLGRFGSTPFLVGGR